MKKVFRTIITFIVLFIFCFNFKYSLAQEKLQIDIGSVSGYSSEQVIVPISFKNVPQKGIMGCDFRVSFDSNNLEFKEAKIGELILNAKDFSYNKRDNTISIFFADESLKDRIIKKDGIFINLVFLIKTDTKEGKYLIENSYVGSFADSDINNIDYVFNNGYVTVNKRTSGGGNGSNTGSPGGGVISQPSGGDTQPVVPPVNPPKDDNDKKNENNNPTVTPSDNKSDNNKDSKENTQNNQNTQNNNSNTPKPETKKVVNTNISISKSTVDSKSSIITVTFNTNILKGKDFSKIYLTDSKKRKIKCSITIKNNKLTIKPLSKLYSKQKYTLKIPKNALTDKNKKTINKDYIYSFVKK